MSSRMDDRGAGDDAEAFPFYFFDAAALENSGDGANKSGLRFFRRSIARHELEEKAFARTLERHHFHAALTDDKCIAALDAAEANRLRHAPFSGPRECRNPFRRASF